MSISLEDLAKQTVIRFGKEANFQCASAVLYENGFQDEDGELARRILEMVETSEVRVKVYY